MVVKKFYLVGYNSPEQAREVDITTANDWAALQKRVAEEFNIVEPNSMFIQF